MNTATLDETIHEAAKAGRPTLTRELHAELTEELLLSLRDKLAREHHRHHTLERLERLEARILRTGQKLLQEIGEIKQDVGTEPDFTKEELSIVTVLAQHEGWRHSDPQVLARARVLVEDLIEHRRNSQAMRAAEQVAAQEMVG